MKLDHRRRVPGTGLLLLAAGMTLMAGCSLPTHNKASSSSSPTPAPVVTSPATAAPSPTATTGGSSGGAPAGLVPVEFSVPTTAAGTQQFAVGPDGNVWFTEGDGNKIGDGTAVARPFQNRRADVRDRLGIVELQAACLTAFGEQRCYEDRQLVFFAG